MRLVGADFQRSICARKIVHLRARSSSLYDTRTLMLSPSPVLVSDEQGALTITALSPSSRLILHPQTDKDMFDALLLRHFSPSATGKARWILSVTLIDNTKEHGEVELWVSPEAVFTTDVGTAASGHWRAGLMTPEAVEHWSICCI